MKLLIINPNGLETDTGAIDAAARRYANPSTEIITVHPPRDAQALGGYGAIARDTEAVLHLVRARRSEFDAFVIACFEDPGLYAAREAVDVPVFGIAESAMLMACTLGHTFSIITTPARYRPITTNLVRLYGLEHRCASVRTVDLPDAIEPDNDAATQAILAGEGQRALEKDGAEVLVLGCGKLSRFDKPLERDLGVPVLDGVACAVKLAEASVGYGLRTSKRLGFAAPGADGQGNRADATDHARSESRPEAWSPRAGIRRAVD
jgi:allantoin racemase